MGHPFTLLVDVDGAGSHPAAWQLSGADPVELVSARHLAEAVHAAETAGFTAVTFEERLLPAGAPAQADAILRASFLAPQTSAIGLIPVVPAALYGEPFHISTQLASLDLASLGRGGWIAAADGSAALAARYGREPLSADEADGELADVIEVVRRLWDSWEDDAVIRDVSTGRYLDRDKLHYADFSGRRFSVKGPSISPRPPQGQLPTFAPAGTQAEADAVLITSGETTDALLGAATQASLAARSAAPEGTLVILELDVVLDSAGLTAADRLTALDARSEWASGRARYTGDAAGLVALLGELAAVVDGVRLFPAVLPTDLDELARAVLPALRAAGVFTSPRPGDTLRAGLGLARPANRFLEPTR